MIPACFSEYKSMIPLLNEVVEWTLLKKWSLSEVYRITLTTGESRIVKWGGRGVVREAETYRSLVHPLEVKAPRIYEIFRQNDSAVIIMEDAGGKSLINHPHPVHFLEASRELARIRTRATVNLEKRISKKDIEAHFVPLDHFLWMLEDLLTSKKTDPAVLLKIKKVLPLNIVRLYHRVPPSIVHQDLHANNLIIQDDGIMPIDWSVAYISPHLGDLYRLIGEAEYWCNLTRSEIISAYLEVADVHLDQLNWQLRVGGICTMLRVLHWVVNGGTNVDRRFESWEPSLLKNLDSLYQEFI